MAKAKLSEAEFIQAFEMLGPRAMARKHNLNSRGLLERRRRIEGRIGRKLIAPPYGKPFNHNARHLVTVTDGYVLIGSDGHYWPGEASTAHRAFVHLAKELSPQVVIMNGDAIDGARISRHAPIGWEHTPTLKEELEACQERLHEVIDASPKAQHIWNLGNHDARFETKLATVAKEYEKIKGVHLQDHFPLWKPSWSTAINWDGEGDSVMVKHRFKGGIHAAFNNVREGGVNMVTGHLHKLMVTPFTDYNGTRFGVDTGCLAEPHGDQFIDYTEDNPLNWRSGFVVLKFKDSRMRWPQICHVVEPDLVEYQGELIGV